MKRILSLSLIVLSLSLIVLSFYMIIFAPNNMHFLSFFSYIVIIVSYFIDLLYLIFSIEY